MEKSINQRKFLFWAKLLIIIATMPIILYPYILSQCDAITYENFKIFFLLYPIYAISSAMMAWISFRSRPEISIILILLMGLSHFAIWMLPSIQ